MFEKMLNRSALVVAHPDDEVLWFSSIVNKVDEVIACFLECESHPEITAGRRKAFVTHPIANMSCLELREAGVFAGGNWRKPIRLGMAVARHLLRTLPAYHKNHNLLKGALKARLGGYENVFTHNPWGEYGNREHVQVYQATKDLQAELGFALWFPNYCSNKSVRAATAYLSRSRSCYVTLRTNKELGSRLMEFYRANSCWTWYEGYEWFDEESFTSEENSPPGGKSRMYGFPLNLIVLGAQHR